MIRLFRFLVPVIFLISIFGCSTAKRDATRAALIDSLRSEYSDVMDSIDHTWTVMIEDDDEKIMFMKRLLKEVEYTQNYDLPFHEKMDSMITSLKEIRYDRSTMAISSRIDDYDIATIEVADELIKYVQKHPDYERYPLMEELVQDIRQKNSDVLMLRVDYDQSARLYNSFVTENKKYMSDIDSTYVEKLPLFAIE